MVEPILDDDDQSAFSYDAHSLDEQTSTERSVREDDRDEVQEVERITLKDTRRLRFWRLIVTLVILLTALAVTLTTYFLLQEEQKENFESSVRTAA